MNNEVKVEVKPVATRKPATQAPKQIVRKEYSPELKAKVIKEVLAGEKMTVVSKRHGVSYMTCVGWLDAARKATKTLPLSVSRTVEGDDLRIGKTQSGRAFINKGGHEIILEAKEVEFLLETLRSK